MACSDRALAGIEDSIDRVNESQISEIEKINQIIPFLLIALDHIRALELNNNNSVTSYENQLKHAKASLEFVMNSGLSENFVNQNKIFWDNAIINCEEKLSHAKSECREIPYLKRRYERRLADRLDRKAILDEETRPYREWIALIKIEYKRRERAGEFQKEYDKNKYPNHVTREASEYRFEEHEWKERIFPKIKNMSLDDLESTYLEIKKLNDKEDLRLEEIKKENKAEKFLRKSKEFGTFLIKEPKLIVRGFLFIVSTVLVTVIASPIWIPVGLFAGLFLLSKSFYNDKSFKNTLESLFEPELPPPLAKEQNQKSTSEHFSSPLLSVISKDNQQNISIESINVPLLQTI